MAGTVERQALKKAALLALEESRGALRGEVSRVRVEWNPREMVRQSVEKHKIAIVIGTVVAGLVAARLFVLPRRSSGAKTSIRSRLTGLAATALWSAFHEPILDFARQHLSSYFGKSTPPEEIEKPQ